MNPSSEVGSYTSTKKKWTSERTRKEEKDMDKTTGLIVIDGKSFNCCESTLLNIHREYPLPGFESNVMRVASLTGAGVGWSGGACGAVVGIATALGLVYGTDGEESLEEFQEKRGRNKALNRSLLREF